MIKISIDKYKKICLLYSKNWSQQKIANKYNVTQNCIMKILKKNRIKCRPTKVSIQFNEYFFDSIDTEIKAYWLGFITADGCIQIVEKRQNMLTIALSYKDSSHLNNFIKDINSKHNLYRYKSKDSNGHYHDTVRITLSSDHLIKSLLKLNIGPRKTNTISFPSVKKPLLNHFMRGYFDGDGSVYLKSPDKRKGRTVRQLRTVIVGNEKFIKQYNCHLSALSKIKLPNITHDKSISRIDVQGNNQAQQIYKFLYKNATRFMKRKKQIFNNNLPPSSPC